MEKLKIGSEFNCSNRINGVKNDTDKPEILYLKEYQAGECYEFEVEMPPKTIIKCIRKGTPHYGGRYRIDAIIEV